MCLAFCTLYVERGATPALHLMGRGWGFAGGGGVASGGVLLSPQNWNESARVSIHSLEKHVTKH